MAVWRVLVQLYVKVGAGVVQVVRLVRVELVAHLGSLLPQLLTVPLVLLPLDPPFFLLNITWYYYRIKRTSRHSI